MKLLRCLALQAAACLIGLACAHAAGTVTVALTGDIMMGTTYPATRLPQQDGRLLFSDVKALLQKADIVSGHGPHVCRAIELYKNHLIAYSLGNFCTPFGISVEGKSGYAPLLEVRTLRDGRFVSGRIHSFIQQYGMGPRFDPDGNAAREIRRLTSLDMPGTPLLISGDGTISRKHGHAFRH